MKSPVFLNQNQTGFSWPLSQPNSQAKKLPALTALCEVDQNSWGKAITEAVKKKTVHWRHSCVANAIQAPMVITTIKLCACTRGNNPAATPAAIMRLIERDDR